MYSVNNAIGMLMAYNICIRILIPLQLIVSIKFLIPTESHRYRHQGLANEQGYYYQNKDVNQQRYQNKDVNQQYYQNNDAMANRYQDALQREFNS